MPELPLPAFSREALDQFRSALTTLLASGSPFLEAIVQAGDAALSAGGDPRPLLNVAANMTVDFEYDSGAQASQDAMAISRIVEATLKAAHELRSVESTELNLPFLAATPDGPKHLQRALTRAEFSELATRPPRTPGVGRAEPLDEAQLEEQREAAKKRKKRWWPF